MVSSCKGKVKCFFLPLAKYKHHAYQIYHKPFILQHKYGISAGKKLLTDARPLLQSIYKAYKSS